MLPLWVSSDKIVKLDPSFTREGLFLRYEEL